MICIAKLDHIINVKEKRNTIEDTEVKISMRRKTLKK